MEKLSAQAIQDAGLADWRKLLLGLHARFRTGSFAEGVRFVSAVGEAVENVPEIRLGDGFVDLRVGAADERDLDLARTISSIAHSQGLQADPSAVAYLELGLDTADRDAIGPFWAAVLTGDPAAYAGDDIVDPTGRVSTIWLQATEPHETPKQRFHLDLWLAPEEVPGRIKAALAAGGTVTYDDEAPAFTVLADPQGNKVCLCTYLSR